MMSHDDRAAIDGLFRRLDQVAAQGAPRDAEAEAYLRDQFARNPAHSYYLAQTVIMQQHALDQAQNRIADLEAQAQSQTSGGFFGSLFGSSRPAPQRPMARPMPSQMPGQMPMQPYGQPQGGGFLAGAAQTAMGVAGGVLLGNMLMGMFEGDEAQAAEDEAPAEEEFGFGDEEL